jgi:hypothetical protein
MQILGILDANGKVVERATVTMFRSRLDDVEIADRGMKRGKHFVKAGKPGQFDMSRANWEDEFARVFPLEDGRYASNRTNQERLAEYAIAV